jgi:hypothetical protein
VIDTGDETLAAPKLNRRTFEKSVGLFDSFAVVSAKETPVSNKMILRYEIGPILRHGAAPLDQAGDSTLSVTDKSRGRDGDKSSCALAEGNSESIPHSRTQAGPGRGVSRTPDTNRNCTPSGRSADALSTIILKSRRALTVIKAPTEAALASRAVAPIGRPMTARKFRARTSDSHRPGDRPSDGDQFDCGRVPDWKMGDSGRILAT